MMHADMNMVHIQLSTSSLAIHGGAIFSAVSGRKSIPISAIEAPEHGACYRVHGFYLHTSTPGRFPFKLPFKLKDFPSWRPQVFVNCNKSIQTKQENPLTNTS